MKHIPTLQFVALLMAWQAAASPIEFPYFQDLIEFEIGGGSRVVDADVTIERLQSDVRDVSHYGNLKIYLEPPVALVCEICRGDGFVAVGVVLKRDEAIPAYGNAVAANRDGRWLADVNVHDLRTTDGSPVSESHAPSTIVIETDSDLVAGFQAGRVAALSDVELWLESRIRAAQREAEANAAQALAEIVVTYSFAQENAEQIGTWEASAETSAESISSLLVSGSKHPVKVTHEGRRVQGTLWIAETGANHAAGTLSLDIGGGEFRQTPISITAAAGPGLVVARYPAFNGFKNRVSYACYVQGAYSETHGILSMAIADDHDDRRMGSWCRTDRIVIDLSGAQ